MEDSTVQQEVNDTDEQLQHIKGVIESLLFVNERPVTLEQIKKVLETVGGPEIKKAIVDLQDGYETKKCGMMIIEIAGGYQMLSNPAYASYLRNFYQTKHKEKLSKPALESMAIIAYKQPVTRSDIELIRGVNSDGVVAHLLSKELIKVVGRKDVPGRPFMYGTTKQFLEYFGLKSVDDLPTLEEFPTLQPAAESNMLPIDDVEGDVQEALPESEASEAAPIDPAAQADEIMEDDQAVQASETMEEAEIIKAVDKEPEVIEPNEAVEISEEAMEEILTVDEPADLVETEEDGSIEDPRLSEERTEDPIGETEQQECENEPEESAQKN